MNQRISDVKQRTMMSDLMDKSKEDFHNVILKYGTLFIIKHNGKLFKIQMKIWIFMCVNSKKNLTYDISITFKFLSNSYFF